MDRISIRSNALPTGFQLGFHGSTYVRRFFFFFFFFFFSCLFQLNVARNSAKRIYIGGACLQAPRTQKPGCTYSTGLAKAGENVERKM